MAISKTDIAKLYIAMFDRAPDGEGLNYWYNEALSGKSLEQIANEMAGAAKKLYPDDYPQYGNYDPSDADSVKAVIDTVYQVLFNKDSSTDPEGVNHWVEDITSGRMDLGTAIVTLEKAAEEYLNSDDEAAKAAAETFVNRADVAVKTADSIKSADINGDGKIDSQDFGVFQNIVKTVTNDETTVEQAQSLIKDYTPVTVDLTTAKDEIVGSKAADTFNATVSSLSSEATLNSGDKVDGSDGVDTLNINMLGSFSGVGTDGYIKNVENVNLTNGTTINRTFDATNVSGVEKYNLTGSDNGNSISLSNLNAAGIEVGLNNMSQNMSISFDADLDLSGSDDAMTLTINNLGKADPTPDNSSDDTTYAQISMSNIYQF
jgi:hypothetical protein